MIVSSKRPHTIRPPPFVTHDLQQCSGGRRVVGIRRRCCGWRRGESGALFVAHHQGGVHRRRCDMSLSGNMHHVFAVSGLVVLLLVIGILTGITSSSESALSPGEGGPSPKSRSLSSSSFGRKKMGQANNQNKRKIKNSETAVRLGDIPPPRR